MSAAFRRCTVPRCRRAAQRNRLKCACCRMRAWRRHNPFQAAFATLRDHAKARSIEFSLTFEEFRKFADRNSYIDRRGPFAASLTVDRKDNLRGYSIDNVQPLTRSANSVKRCKQDEHRMRAGFAWSGR